MTASAGVAFTASAAAAASAARQKQYYLIHVARTYPVGNSGGVNLEALHASWEAEVDARTVYSR